jgi:hypothetical protein|tara:strand:+ start:208 stop:594 length:387 start_codon:yes stop_codon:yes gene_type:complete
MLDLDNSQISEEDKKMFEEMDHYSALKTELGYDTVWSIESGMNGLDFNIFSDKPRKVTYKIIDRMGDSFDDVDWVTFSSVAKDGTIGALWAAAEDCFQQAKENNGDWHYFVENFEVQDDGSLSLVTGS